MKILVIGDPIIDKFTFVNINRMSPENNSVPVLDIQNTSTRLGGALNVACNLKSLFDLEDDIFVCAPISAWTSYELTFRCINLCCRSLYSDKWEPSKYELTKNRFIDIEMNKQIIRVDNRLKFNEDTIKKFKKNIADIKVDDFDCIVISDYNKGCIGWNVVDKLKGLGCPIFVDTKQKDVSMWKDFDNLFLKINWNEFQSSEHLNQIKNVIVTHGDKPVQLRKYGQLKKKFEVCPVEKADVVGAGDVFFAALVSEYLKNKDIEKSIKFAIKASRKSVQKQGTCIVTRGELE